MKKTVNLQANWYGVVDEISEGKVCARLYDAKLHELIDVIEFPITNFPLYQRTDVVLYSIFTWRVGLISNRSFSYFRVKYKNNKKTKEEIEIEVNQLIGIFK